MTQLGASLVWREQRHGGLVSVPRCFQWELWWIGVLKCRGAEPDGALGSVGITDPTGVGIRCAVRRVKEASESLPGTIFARICDICGFQHLRRNRWKNLSTVVPDPHRSGADSEGFHSASQVWARPGVRSRLSIAGQKAQRGYRRPMQAEGSKKQVCTVLAPTV